MTPAVFIKRMMIAVGAGIRVAARAVACAGSAAVKKLRMELGVNVSIIVRALSFLPRILSIVEKVIDFRIGHASCSAAARRANSASPSRSPRTLASSPQETTSSVSRALPNAPKAVIRLLTSVLRRRAKAA